MKPSRRQLYASTDVSYCRSYVCAHLGQPILVHQLTVLISPVITRANRVYISPARCRPPAETQNLFCCAKITTYCALLLSDHWRSPRDADAQISYKNLSLFCTLRPKRPYCSTATQVIPICGSARRSFQSTLVLLCQPALQGSDWVLGACVAMEVSRCTGHINKCPTSSLRFGALLEA